MKKIFFIIAFSLLAGFASAQIITDAKPYVDANIISNGANQITGPKLNTALNKIMQYIIDSLDVDLDSLVFRKNGLLVKKALPAGQNFGLRWPLYIDEFRDIWISLSYLDSLDYVKQAALDDSMASVRSAIIGLGGGITTLTGDVSATGSGSVPGTVTGIRGNNIPSLSSGNLRWNGSAWVFDNTSYLTSISGISAGGDLSGTYTNPTVSGIKGNAVPTLSTGLLKWNGSAWVFDATAYLSTAIAASTYQPIGSYLTAETDPKRVVSAAFTGTTIKTLTLTLADASTVTAAFTDSSGGGGSSYITQTHTSGSTVTVANNADWLIVNPGSLLSTLTITMPASPTDRQEVTISFGGTITGGSDVVTTLTVSPNSGQTLVQNYAPTYMQSGESITYKYNSSTTKWYAK